MLDGDFIPKSELSEPNFWRLLPSVRFGIIAEMDHTDLQVQKACFDAMPLFDRETGEEIWDHYGEGPDTKEEATAKLDNNNKYTLHLLQNAPKMDQVSAVDEYFGVAPV